MKFLLFFVFLCSKIIIFSSHSDVAEAAVWALCNIIKDGQEFRDYLIQLGTIEPLSL
jgi:hypothetical protein